MSGSTCTHTASNTYGATPATYSCTSGDSLSGSTCTHSVSSTYGASPASYSCSSGDTLSSTTCTHTAGSTYGASPASYSCNVGDSLSGSTCTHSTSSTYGGTPTSYSCSAGDTLSGSTCSHTASATATPVYGCSSGTYSGGSCIGGTAQSSTAYIYLGTKQIAEWDSVNGTQFVHTDAFGSPVAHTNGSGTVMNRTRFEAYGYPAAGTKPTPNTSVIGFTGHVQDTETDLVYMQQRYYDPMAGRFLSVDPIVTSEKNGNGFNRFMYVENNPLRYTDPDGLKCAGTGSAAKCTIDLVDGKPLDREKLAKSEKATVTKIESALTAAYKGALANGNVTFSLQTTEAGTKSNITGGEIANILQKAVVNFDTTPTSSDRMAQAAFINTDRQKPEITFFSAVIGHTKESMVDSNLRQASAHEPIHLAQEFYGFHFNEKDGHREWFNPAVRALLKSSGDKK